MRFKLHDDPDHPFSEAVGLVMEVDEDSFTVLKRNGQRVVIPHDDVIAAKTFESTG